MFKKNNKVKGSILFTVVSVMAILIIFLMGTLVLATSASNRAHRTYSTSQTQYTARTAIDSILEAFSSSDDFAEAICDLSPSNSSLTVDVELDQSTLASMGDIHDVVVEYVGQQKYYNEETNAWEDKDQLKITAQVTLGGITKTVTGFIVKDPPLIYSNDGGGAGFVTAGNASTENHTSAFGGTYFNINRELQSLRFDSYDLGAETKLYWSNKTFKLGNGQVIEAPFVTNGNLYINTENIFIFPTTGTGIAVWGDLTLQNSDGFVLTSENVTSGKTYNYNEIPYLYVDGTFKTEGSNKIGVGNDKLPLNIFCGKTEITSGSGVNIYADMYIMDNSNSFIKAMNSGSLLGQWTSDVLNKTRDLNAVSHSSGSMFSKGSLTLEDFSVKKDVRVENDLTINANSTDVTIDGDVVVGGKLTITGRNKVSIGGKIYCDTKKIEAPGVVATKSLKADLEEKTYYAALDTSILENIGKWVDVEGNEITSDKNGNPVDVIDLTDNELNPAPGCPTDENGNYAEYSDKNGTPYYAPEYVAYKNISTGSYVKEADAFEETGQSYNGTAILPSALYTDSIYPAEMEKKAILGLTELKDTNGNILSKGETQIVQTLSELGSNACSINPFTADTVYEIPSSFNDKVNAKQYTESTLPAEIKESCTLTGQFNKTTININPGNDTIWIKIDNVDLQQTDIIVNDDAGRVNFFIEKTTKSKYSLNLFKSSILTKSFSERFKAKDEIIINTYGGTSNIKAPNIYIYAGSDVDYGDSKETEWYSIGVPNGGHITGYIKAPWLDYICKSFDGDALKINADIKYNGVTFCGKGNPNYELKNLTTGRTPKVKNTNQIPVIGSLTVGSFQGDNDLVILYVNNSKSADSSLIFNPSKTNWLLPIYYEEY
ncbi:MAG: hypothetical protein MR836_09010 [Ruminococcus sp.]|nr:hypothetical protein [Ruminococcus sp.]